MQKYRIKIETTTKGSKYYPEVLSKFLWFKPKYEPLYEESFCYSTGDSFTYPKGFASLEEAEAYIKDLNPTVYFVYIEQQANDNTSSIL